MRPFPTLLSAVILFAAVVPAHAAELRYFDDAALRAVHFVDLDEGWAVGDDGAVWHTIDSGHNWERQPTGVRASLRSVCFLPGNPFVGWIAGREELPQGGSVGALLFTSDGGLTWKRVLLNALPGLNVVHFVDDKTGFLAGDGSDGMPSGVFTTSDGGKSWLPMPGPRTASWLAGDFSAGPCGALAGAWNRLANLRRDHVAQVDVDALGGRSLRGVKLLQNGLGVAVGQGGLVLLTRDGGTRWIYGDTGLPVDVQAAWDFDAVHAFAAQVWAVGRPGSAVLHSRDQGRTWEVQQTRQSLPLHGVFFKDDKHGWAVGELGVILGTENGGKTWQVQRRGGQRAAALFVHARPGGMPLDTVAQLGGEDGYFTAGLRVTGADFATASPARGTEALRFAAAMRQAGGVGGDMLWQFPIASHQARADRKSLLASWDQLHGGRAADEMLRQVVLAVRVWRPDVIVTDNIDPETCPYPADVLLAEAVREAFRQAGDPKAFPEQLGYLGLEPWKAGKLYSRWDGKTVTPVLFDLTKKSDRLGCTIQEFAGEPTALLIEGAATVPVQRGYRLLAANVVGAENHTHLMDGLTSTAGPARRAMQEVPKPTAEEIKASHQAVALKAIAEAPPSSLTDPDRLLGQLGPMLADLPDDRAGRAAHSVAWHYARMGQWNLAREAFLLMVDRYPGHPLAVDAYRWLLCHNASSEARHRHEMGQFLLLRQEKYGMIEPKTGPNSQSLSEKGSDPLGISGGLTPFRSGSQPKGPEVPAIGSRVEQYQIPVSTVTTNGVEGLVEMTKVQANQALAAKAAAREWYKSALDFESKLDAFGPLFANDPRIQFPLQSARRRLGDPKTALDWYRQFAAKQPTGPWRDAALTELWLANRSGQPPKPLAVCRGTDVRPVLDGKMDDACWQAGQPLRLQNAAGDTIKDFPTEVRMAYDPQYLYLAIRCFHPDGWAVPAAKNRKHDEDLSGFDRVSVLLDLDRDYSTCYHLQIDQRGCVAEDCWGDKTWDPRWFVAVRSEARCWVAEVAIPLEALTGDGVTPGTSWACNVIRVMPGRGVQAWSLPAEVPEESLRPEGMGLLMFLGDAPATTAAAPGVGR